MVYKALITTHHLMCYGNEVQLRAEEEGGMITSDGDY